jgi:hypothetical protein
LGGDSFCDRIAFPCFACTPYRPALGNNYYDLPQIDTEPFGTLHNRNNTDFFNDYSLYFHVFREA